MRAPQEPTGPLADIVVVGAGASAALLVTALRRHPGFRDGPGPERRIVVVGHGHPTGRGVAYSTPDPRHLMNVPAHRLSLDPAAPDDLVRWLRRQGGPHQGPMAYVPRQVYGRYVAEALVGTAGDPGPGSGGLQVELAEGPVTGLVPDGPTWRVERADGGATPARAVVVATGVPPGPPPLAVPPHPRVVVDPWAPGALDGVAGCRHVLAVGTGLTLVDVALTATAAGATVEAVSRHGDLPRTHPPSRPPAARPLDPTTVPATAAAVRRHLVEAARTEPRGWPAAVDDFRDHLDVLWGALPPAEQAKLLRRGASLWSVHRHRMAPEVGRQVDALVADGRLRVRRGRPAAVCLGPDGVEVVVEAARRRRRPPEVLRGDLLVLCTGPLGDITSTTDPLLGQLLADGLAVPGPHRLGLLVDGAGAVVDAGGRAQPSLLALGALRRGVLAETTAIPELRDQATALAAHLATALAAPGPGPGRETAR